MATKPKPKPDPGITSLHLAAFALIGALDRAAGNGAHYTLATTDALAWLKTESGYVPPAPVDADETVWFTTAS